MMSSDKKSDVGQTAEAQEVDIYRDTPVRLLGESLAPGLQLEILLCQPWLA